MDSPTRIDDLVVLGRAAPEPIRDGRHTVCLGGYSETYGYVRIYPTRMSMDRCRRWNVISVPVERSDNDNRDESFKIRGSREEWDSLHTKIEKVGRLSKPERIRLADRLAGDCSNRLNEQRKSLGMVKPEGIDAEVREEETTIQATLNDRLRKGKSDYPETLYISYRCDDCDAKTHHEQHCIEWGVHQYWDNNDDPEGVIDALHLYDDTTEHYFFIGNLNNQRTAYIIISVIRFKHSDMLDAGVAVPGQSQLAGDWE